jgi:hypothetical protein
MGKADQTLTEVFRDLGIHDRAPGDQYSHPNAIVANLARRNAKKRFNVHTTGAISERLCELALQAECRDRYDRLPRDWKWLGDFSIHGSPFNVLLSVKTFKAKERLLASRSGNLLTPTIGWGLFDDAGEWSECRVRSYVSRSFVAIYMPEKTLPKLPSGSRLVRNFNGKPLLRPVIKFATDLRQASTASGLDIRRL